MNGFHIKTTFIVLFLSIMYSCEKPRSRRPTTLEDSKERFSYSPSYEMPQSINTNQIDTNDKGFDDKNNSDNSSTSSTENVSIPQEISHCTWNLDGKTKLQYNHQIIGDYTLCQASNDESTIWIQVSNPITDSALCFVPVTSDNNNSTYVGEPRCTYIYEQSKVYPIKLYKNRSGYYSYPINGVMVMKDKPVYFPQPFNMPKLVPDAYIFCMEYLARTGDGGYCESFDSAGQYINHQFN
mgnify:CR=1 FL=1